MESKKKFFRISPKKTIKTITMEFWWKQQKNQVLRNRKIREN
jgi:hypothetical protein